MTPEQTDTVVQQLVNDGMRELRAVQAALVWNSGRRLARNAIENIAFTAFARVEGS